MTKNVIKMTKKIWPKNMIKKYGQKIWPKNMIKKYDQKYDQKIWPKNGKNEIFIFLLDLLDSSTRSIKISILVRFVRF